MWSYLGKRLAQLVVIAFVISILVFLLVHLLPGDPTVTILGPSDTHQARQELLKQLGLDKPLYEQYFIWLWNILQGNLGQSFLTHETVASAVGHAAPIDIELIIGSQLVAVLVAVPLALLAALRPNRAFDRSATTTTFGLLSFPSYVAGVLMVDAFAVGIHLFPASGFTPITQSLTQNLRGVTMPIIALTLGSVAIYFRLLRADLIATLQEDFVTMARAKGLSTRYILTRHALRPSSFALLAGAGISIGSLLTGTFVIEYYFNMAGMAATLVDAIQQRDYLVVQGLALIISVAYVIINMVVDFLLTLLDPRIRRA